ncbi:transposase [Komagataeibacter europaeus LMG 18890]|nr:transposase [Komagataeibacter europaeus LMG 18890]
MKVGDFQDFPVPEPQYKIPITKSAEEPIFECRLTLWRSLKYECVYLHAFETGSELRAGLGRWIAHYNERRPHTALAGRTPDEAYHDVPTPSGPGLTPDQMANSNAVRRAA